MINNLKMTFHHIGKPVPLEQIKENPRTRYSKLFDMYTLDNANSLSMPIQLHAFGKNSSLHHKIQTETHVAFKVDNIELAMEGLNVLMPLYQPFANYRCAMVLVNGQTIELIETSLSEQEIWGDDIFKDSLLYAN